MKRFEGKTVAAAAGNGAIAPALAQEIVVAFDYRGEATLTLDDGEAVAGYVMDPGPGEIRLWTADGRSAAHVASERVTHVALTGRDPAAV